MTTEFTNFLMHMAHSPLQNYGAIPGLTSWLIGEAAPDGSRVRLLHCARQHFEPITPHSHRFDFHCLVLKGRVINEIWTPRRPPQQGDMYQSSTLIYSGTPGEYAIKNGPVERWVPTPSAYNEGDRYSMEADEVHSIWFDRGTWVLFFEGKTKSAQSMILQPFVNDEVVPTFNTPSWAFKREAAACP